MSTQCSVYLKLIKINNNNKKEQPKKKDKEENFKSQWKKRCIIFKGTTIRLIADLSTKKMGTKHLQSTERK